MEIHWLVRSIDWIAPCCPSIEYLPIYSTVSYLPPNLDGTYNMLWMHILRTSTPSPGNLDHRSTATTAR